MNYTHPQLLVLILFKDFRNQHFLEFIEDVGDMEGVQEIQDLSVVPHVTTHLKFLSQLKTHYLRITFRKTVNLFYSSNKDIPIPSIDSSGLRADTADIISRKESGNSENISGKLRYQLIPTKSLSPDLLPQKAGSTIPGMPKNYSANAKKPERLIVSSWTTDNALKVFTG